MFPDAGSCPHVRPTRTRREFIRDGFCGFGGLALAAMLDHLAGAGLADFYRGDVGREIAADLERYMRSASTNAKSRVALMRLIWDFLGTEFGSRHAQYEKFYGGASFLVKQNVFRNFDFKRATALVDRALKLPPLEEA